MKSVFKKIIDRELPAHIVYEDTNYLAFLDVNPLAKGHTLVIPKNEIDYIFDMEASALAEFNLVAQKIAIAIKKTIECKKIGLAVIGLEVPHAHIHLVPINNVGDLNFSAPRVSFTDSEYLEIASAISKNIQ